MSDTPVPGFYANIIAHAAPQEPLRPKLRVPPEPLKITSRTEFSTVVMKLFEDFGGAYAIAPASSDVAFTVVLRDDFPQFRLGARGGAFAALQQRARTLRDAMPYEIVLHAYVLPRELSPALQSLIDMCLADRDGAAEWRTCDPLVTWLGAHGLALGSVRPPFVSR